jgi:Raf kinase inhibitor-like YbhB/YbcL family protein
MLQWVWAGAQGRRHIACERGPDLTRTNERLKMQNREMARPAQSATRESARELRLTSLAFADAAQIPKIHTADGQGISPALTWSSPPPDTQSFALVCEDPDAPSGTFIHWLIWNLPSTQRQLAEGFPSSGDRSGARQGLNGFGGIGYAGPKPPPGPPHRYFFRIFALDHRIDLPDGATRSELDRAMDGHILAEGALVGMYGRNPD